MLIIYLAQSADFIGIIGVILMLTGYYLLNTYKVTAAYLSYQLLNLFGASFILFSLLFKWNLASVIIETIWILISMIGIYKIVRVKLNNCNSHYKLTRK